VSAILDLRSEAESFVIEGTFPALDPRERALVEETWRGRMVNEHISAQVFAGLVPQAMRAAIPHAFLVELAEMVGDELDHARRCAGVLHALGGDPRAPLPELRKLPEHATASPLGALLRNVISVSCMSETVAVALIQAERIDLGGSPAAKVLGSILGDEVRHARFGWKLIEELAPLSNPVREEVGAYLPVALAHLVAHELDHLSPAPPPTKRAAQCGACDGQNARLILFQTIETVIVPGLERFGLPARGSWQEARKLLRSGAARAMTAA
jgi:hypothetical protein